LKVRWLGNACLEVFGDRQFLIDPNFLLEPEKTPELILLTHEHDDHYSPEKCAKILPEVTLYATKTTLNKFGLDGVAVKAGDKIGAIRVLESDCWGSEESVSYFYKGLLHTGDSAEFPKVDDTRLVFTACFPDYYDDYVRAFKRLKPNLVIPFHYDVQRDLDEAMGLKRRCDEEGINCRLMRVGESIEKSR
jgi:L-ascorbate metabolism protein UlaG (beta-lactamase superfamily)